MYVSYGEPSFIRCYEYIYNSFSSTWRCLTVLHMVACSCSAGSVSITFVDLDSWLNIAIVYANSLFAMWVSMFKRWNETDHSFRLNGRLALRSRLNSSVVHPNDLMLTSISRAQSAITSVCQTDISYSCTKLFDCIADSCPHLSRSISYRCHQYPGRAGK